MFAQHTGCTICTLCTSSIILQGTILIELSIISPNNMGCESHHSNHRRQMCVCVSLCLSVCVCLFVKVCCVFGRECNNCLRLIPECDELSVPVKYLPHSLTLCVCCATPYYCTVCLRAVPLHCVLVRAVSSHCVFAVLLYAIPISQ